MHNAICENGLKLCCIRSPFFDILDSWDNRKGELNVKLIGCGDADTDNRTGGLAVSSRSWIGRMMLAKPRLWKLLESLTGLRWFLIEDVSGE